MAFDQLMRYGTKTKISVPNQITCNRSSPPLCIVNGVVITKHQYWRSLGKLRLEAGLETDF